MSFSLQDGKHGIWYGAFSSFSEQALIHGISTRFGGVSQPPFAKLNLAMHNGDDVAAVQENRRRFCRALGADAAQLCSCDQVHGTAVFRVTRAQAGAGSLDYASAIRETDALITDEKDVPLLLFFADCTPILFFDPRHRAAGIAHGGWKGTVGKIAQKTVLAMQREFGTRPEDCLVGIGPAIGPCCYEVDSAISDQFAAAFPQNQAEIILAAGGGKQKLDLWAANRCQLEEIGVQQEHIDVAAVCTQCNSDVFFSYRADQGHTGRIGALLCLK